MIPQNLGVLAGSKYLELGLGTARAKQHYKRQKTIGVWGRKDYTRLCAPASALQSGDAEFTTLKLWALRAIVRCHNEALRQNPSLVVVGCWSTRLTDDEIEYRRYLGQWMVGYSVRMISGVSCRRAELRSDESLSNQVETCPSPFFAIQVDAPIYRPATVVLLDMSPNDFVKQRSSSKSHFLETDKICCSAHKGGTTLRHA